MKTRVILSALLLTVAGSITTVWAEGEMTFHGTLIEPPPCVINDGQQVEVNFGDRIGVNKVDGSNYRKAVSYQITCESGETSGAALKLSLAGTASGFDTEALQTNMNDLGIRIYRNDVSFTPNSELDIDITNPPRLEAVPVKRPGSTLKEGAFEALATLRAEYQ